MKGLFIFLLIFTCAYAPVCLAAKVGGLYQAEAAVADKSEPARWQAIATAMKIVLVKLTGDRRAALKPDLKGIVSNAGKYVQQFSYRQRRRIHVNIPATIDANTAGNAVSELSLKVRFDAASLSRDLRLAGVSLWGNERPAVLLWLLVQQDNRRRLASLEQAPEMLEILYRRAEQRGIRLIFPLMDLQDTRALRPADIRGGFAEPVLTASARYQPDIVLTGDVRYLSTGLWQARWTAYDGDESAFSWDTEADLPALALDEGLDVLVDDLALRYSTGGELSALRLFVEGVLSADDYARLLRYLGSLSAIERVDVIEADADQLVLSLTAHGGGPAVAQAITLGRVLQAVDGGPANRYQLLP